MSVSIHHNNILYNFLVAHNHSHSMICFFNKYIYTGKWFMCTGRLVEIATSANALYILSLRLFYLKELKKFGDRLLQKI
jgi:hypothetical protein